MKYLHIYILVFITRTVCFENMNKLYFRLNNRLLHKLISEWTTFKIFRFKYKSYCDNKLHSGN